VVRRARKGRRLKLLARYMFPIFKLIQRIQEDYTRVYIYIGNNFYEAKLQRRQQTYSNHIAKLLDSRVVEILEIFSEEEQLLMKAVVLIP
jgi:hypothetical protein